MYSHQGNTVQIEALEYDPDIDGNNQSNIDEKHKTASVQGTLEPIPEPSEPEDVNSIAPGNNTVQQDQQETDWPDTPTIQIPGVSSTTDQPPEVMYNRHQVQPFEVDPELPVLEDDSDPDQFPDFDAYMTHHNTYHASERIRKEYSATLHNLSNNEYYTKINRAELQTTHRLCNMTGQHATKKHRDHHRQTSQDDPQKNSKEYLEKAEVKSDRKNFIATNHLTTKPILWKVTSNARSRKINACTKGILHIINILLLYKHYVCVAPCQIHIKALQLNVQHNNNSQNPGINPLIKKPGTD